MTKNAMISKLDEGLKTCFILPPFDTLLRINSGFKITTLYTGVSLKNYLKFILKKFNQRTNSVKNFLMFYFV